MRRDGRGTGEPAPLCGLCRGEPGEEHVVAPFGEPVCDGCTLELGRFLIGAEPLVRAQFFRAGFLPPLPATHELGEAQAHADLAFGFLSTGQLTRALQAAAEALVAAAGAPDAEHTRDARLEALWVIFSPALFREEMLPELRRHLFRS